ncbi:ABC transporter substrate-binding protein [Citrobacter koseri]|uniref:ABC transporter substrate-binding protein n=1 Tax=Citrobacter koseri TaxID=545 RepID=UPI0023B0EE4D|nr:ABC transporter substrate-binding protein [Citrobacter koseri]EKU0540676.1 ABC transporter substrate-binding protein [Citrobacter koseri]EKU8895618.1 ABC transporter substrate-binding protein [Citrobacter koseri]MDT7449561.1 ABC transporter substrate-binding protein [Citrobacter koseri]HEM6797778.1 ABC transporter substrate-binding protein [Citrobacter koseri]HEM6828606.1 ABC transporter substrate-binding protein [Citrobacter koseri]
MFKSLRQLSLLALLFSLPFMAQAERTFTDQIGRQVTVPDTVDRVVVLQHQTLNLLVQMNATDKIVGVMANWKQQLGDGYARLAPELTTKAALGDLTHVDAEKLVALHPQVVFVTNYAPQEMIDKISSLGISVVAISLRHDAVGEQAKMNPTMTDEEQAYDQGLREGITLIGDIVNKPDEAKALIAATDKGRKMVSDRLKDIPEDQRVRAYMANPELTTYGSGKYTGLMMAHAGALNVAASTIKGFKQVAMEQVIAWNPQVIFVQDRYPKVVDEILQSPQWQVIDAVKNHRVYLMPDYAKAWGYPMPEAMGIGELWMAKKLYPQKFQDIDMRKVANDWYQRFYRTDYQGVD